MRSTCRRGVRPSGSGSPTKGSSGSRKVVKGRNRDTAWYAIVDVDWPPVREAFRAWLAPDNFDTGGRQRASLQAAR